MIGHDTRVMKKQMQPRRGWKNHFTSLDAVDAFVARTKPDDLKGYMAHGWLTDQELEESRTRIWERLRAGQKVEELPEGEDGSFAFVQTLPRYRWTKVDQEGKSYEGDYDTLGELMDELENWLATINTPYVTFTVYAKKGGQEAENIGTLRHPAHRQ